ncbi:MAG: M20/M25/M40 family metallo-hydrolase [Lacibacter sp.]
MNVALRINLPLLALLALLQEAPAQKLKRPDKITFQLLQTHTGFLADDRLEGRRTGTAGEAEAARYIARQFEQYGLTPRGTEQWLQPFELNEGNAIGSSTLLILDGEHFRAGTDFFPFAWSANGSVAHLASPSIAEQGAPWFWDLKEVYAENASNPHFDVRTAIRNKATQAAAKGATALLVYNSNVNAQPLQFDGKDRGNTAPIPVLYLQQSIVKRLLQDPTHTWDIQLRATLEPKIRKGTNVVGYIDNNAPFTVVLGAHFDHLGYGEDHNSRHTGEPQIHNGADDNASGTAALLELARLLKKSGTKAYNYLFIAFSGEELGLVGSKHFTDNPTIPLQQVSYMINMDMVGRLNDSSRTITIGGVGTSPAWGNLLYAEKKLPFQIKVDSSGTGPSDHTSFYRKDIPVLFFFTGLHTDYHKPSDDADKINYHGQLQVVNYIVRLINRSASLGKLAFQKTREQQTTTTARFTVSMGIMPDYTFTGGGVKVEGVTEGRPAQKAGIRAGDIVVKVGEYNISTVESYMQTLGRFRKGDKTTVVVQREGKELELPLEF